MWAFLERLRPKPDGALLLDASYEKRELPRRYAIGLTVLAAATALLSVVFWKPLGLIGASGLLIAALVVLIPGWYRMTVQLYEYSLVVLQGTGEQGSRLLHIDYGWIEHTSWDGDRLNLWLNESRHREVPETLGMIIPPEHQQAVSRILWERRGKSREELERGGTSRPI